MQRIDQKKMGKNICLGFLHQNSVSSKLSWSFLPPASTFKNTNLQQAASVA